MTICQGLRKTWILWLLLIWTNIISGCTYHVPLNATTDKLTGVSKIPMMIGVYYSPEFVNYEYVHQKIHRWVLPLGQASVSLFDQVLPPVFEKYVAIERRPPFAATVQDIDAVIEPIIESYSLEFPRYPMLSGDYEASITYRFLLFNIDGDPISSWSVSALARREADLQHNAAIEIGEVTDAAMRAAANKFMEGLRDRPEVREWLDHRTLTAKAHSTPDEKMVSATNAPEEVRVDTPKGIHDYRTDRPLQLQFAVGGVVGFQRGAGLGYHFNEYLYAGIIHWFSDAGSGPSRAYYNFYGQDGVTSNYGSNGQTDLIELRYSPFSFFRPLYVSAGYMIDKGHDEHIVYDVRSRTIGSNVYVTGLDVTIHDHPVSSLSFGVGINYVWLKGWSVSAGFLLGLNHNQTDVAVTATNPSIAPSDIDAFKQSIEDKHRNISIGYLAAGYNF
jgi:hypothetical protein